MQSWASPPLAPFGLDPVEQYPSLSYGGFTHTVRHSMGRILVDLGLIFLGFKLIQYDRTLRRERAHATEKAADVQARRQASSAYQLYDSGVATVQALIYIALSGAFSVSERNFAKLQQLQRRCRSLAGRTEPSSFSREEFTLIREWLVRVLVADGELGRSSRLTFQLLLDLVDLSLATQKKASSDVEPPVMRTLGQASLDFAQCSDRSTVQPGA